MYRTLTAAVILTAAAAAAATPATAAYMAQQLRVRVHQAVIDHHLYAQPDCMEYIITRSAQPGVEEVELRESHGGKCGGDPEAAHRLFEIYVDRKTGKMATDAADPVDGGLQILK